MHPDLEAVVKLWENVHHADTLQRERVDCVEKRQATIETKQQTQTRLDEARAALDTVRTEERRVMRKLGSYRKRVETTRTMIDAGKAPDYRLAEQQLRACIEIADNLETEALELMEQRDAAEAVLDLAEKTFRASDEAAGKAVTRERDRIPAIDLELEDLDLARRPLRSAVTSEHLSLFRALRARKRSAVAKLRSGVCTACKYGAPSQVVNEVVAAQRVHTCRNCGRFLVLDAPT